MSNRPQRIPKRERVAVRAYAPTATLFNTFFAIALKEGERLTTTSTIVVNLDSLLFSPADKDLVCTPCTNQILVKFLPRFKPTRTAYIGVGRADAIR